MISDQKRSRYNPKANSPSVYIPCWLIQVPSSKISFAAKILYGRLAQWSNANGIVHRSVNQLSEEIGMPPKSVERVLKELRDVFLIGTYQVKEGGVNHFEFFQHEWMEVPINNNLEYKSTESPPLRNEGTPPSEMRVPPLRNEGPKIKEIKRNNKSSCASPEKIKNESKTIGCNQPMVSQREDNNKKHDWADNLKKSPLASVESQSTSYDKNKISTASNPSSHLLEYMKRQTA